MPTPDPSRRLKTSNVVHMGDSFFNGIYLFIDVESGGSTDGVKN